MNPLPIPVFITADPDAITAEMVALYEKETDTVLQPAQVERLLIDVIAYRENLLRNAIQEAAMQNLVRYARFPMLDYLGELVGVARLEAQKARALFRFTLAAAQGFSVAIPTGTRIESKDGKQVFTTNAALTIPAGQLSGDTWATAQVAGVTGNGYLAGEVSTLLDPIANVQSVANTMTSAGGFDAESDDRYRERIILAPEAFSTAGSRGAYRFHALKGHQSIVDVSIQRGANGEVYVYPLVETGDPSAAILEAVSQALTDEKVRPISDTVIVQAPVRMDFVIEANVTLYTTADQAFVVSTIIELLTAFAAKLKALLGRDIVPSQFVGVIAQVEGVYQVELVSPSFATVEPNAYANCTGTTINVVGVTDG